MTQERARRFEPADDGCPLAAGRRRPGGPRRRTRPRLSRPAERRPHPDARGNALTLLLISARRSSSTRARSASSSRRRVAQTRRAPLQPPSRHGADVERALEITGVLTALNRVHTLEEALPAERAGSRSPTRVTMGTHSADAHGTRGPLRGLPRARPPKAAGNRHPSSRGRCGWSAFARASERRRCLPIAQHERVGAVTKCPADSSWGGRLAYGPR